MACSGNGSRGRSIIARCRCRRCSTSSSSRRTACSARRLHVAAFLVFVFVTFGALLDRCGGGDFFFDLANSLVGKQVGGPAKVAVVSSGLYGSISGSPTADVVTTGAFTIPMMIRTGLSPVYAGAVEATASTGGALLPPVMGTAAFLMSDFTGIPYGTIAVAAVAPALLYYLRSSSPCTATPARRPEAFGDGGHAAPSSRCCGATGIISCRLCLLIWFVLAYDRPVFSAALALAALVPITLWRTRSLRRPSTTILAAFDDALRRMTGIGVACAVAGLVVGTLAMTDLTGKISSAMFMLAKGNEVLTLMIATVVVIVLGMGMPTPAVYALSAVLAGAGAAGARRADAAGASVHRLFRLDVGDHAAGRCRGFRGRLIARANPMAIGLLCCRLAMVAFIIPFVFIYHPGLLLIGPPAAIATSIGARVWPWSRW